MSYEPERRRFAIGQEMGGVGRWTRLVLGLLDSSTSSPQWRRPDCLLRWSVNWQVGRS